MKYTLTILAFICCSVCMGQFRNALRYPTIDDTAKLFIYKGERYNHVNVEVVPSVRKKDTIMVIGLYIDTTNQPVSSWIKGQLKIKDGLAWVDETIRDTFYLQEDKVKWDYFYSVRELHNTAEGLIDPYFCGNCKYTDYYQHIYYLDKDKQKLSPNIVVWMAK